MNEIKASTGRIVVLGRREENLARVVTFDISEWQQLYGEGIVQLLHQRCQDPTPYPCAITVEGGTVRWVIGVADVAVPGEGVAELQYHVGDAVAKSATYRTLTMPALGEAGPVPPDPEKGWVDQVLQAARNAVAATITIGENENWYINGEDTGVSARGPQGEGADIPEGGAGYTALEKTDLTFDGDLTGKTVVDASSIGQETILVKVSDTPVDLTTIESVEYIWGGEQKILRGEELQIGGESAGDQPFLMTAEAPDEGPVAVSVYMDISLLGINAKRGTYLIYMGESSYTSALRGVEADVIHRIDPKYLPEGGFGYVERLSHIEFSGSYVGPTRNDLVPVSDVVVDLSTVKAVYVSISGGGELSETDVPIEDFEVEYADGQWTLSLVEQVLVASTAEATENFPAGTYFHYKPFGGGAVFVSRIEFAPIDIKTHKIDKKFLPDDIGGGTPGPQGPTGPEGPQGPVGPAGDSGLPTVVSLAGAVQSLALANNTDYRCTDTVTALTVTGFAAGPNDRSEAWSIRFVAGASITVALPDRVVWNYGATPVFTPGSEYCLMFAPLLSGKVLGVWNEVEA